MAGVCAVIEIWTGGCEVAVIRKHRRFLRPIGGLGTQGSETRET